MSKTRIKKATTHVVQNEGLLFEESRTGRIGYSIPKLDVTEETEQRLIPPRLLPHDHIDGFANLHPPTPAPLAPGALEVVFRIEQCLAQITGLAQVTSQPAAGAQGEMTGLMMIRAALTERGNPRKKVLIPDSAHGTNPA